MKHKVIITKEEDRVNGFLDDGWLVESVTSQRVIDRRGKMKSNYSELISSKFCFVLKKSD